MKQEQKRYSLVEYLGLVEKVVDSEKEYNEILEKINRYNRKSSSNRFFGNVSKFPYNQKLLVRVHIYNRLTPKMTISEIDNLTSSFNERELIEYFKNKIKSNKNYIPDLNIAYFEDKDYNIKTFYDFDRRILYLPIIYRDSKCYTELTNIKRMLLNFSENREFDFFDKLLERYSSYISVSCELESLKESIYKTRNDIDSDYSLYLKSKDLLYGLVYEKDKNNEFIKLSDGSIKISRRKLRDFGMFIKQYNDSLCNSPTAYNGYKLKNKINEQELEYMEEIEEDRRLEEYMLDLWDKGYISKLKK